ncbi:hypothetical protein [Schlesneria sp. T3-172]|uniref:hypothetical protein n=1 Tax=Schlesneria sphaerica TaxID=3373610 RepID=UPI0037CB3F43
MALSDIVSMPSRADGWSYDLTVEGFATGATYANGLGTNNATVGGAKAVIAVTSMGFNDAGVAVTKPRSLYGTKCVRKAWPDNATLDETSGGGNLTARIAFHNYLYARDKAGGGNSGTDPVATLLSGFVTNTAGGGQSSSARSSFGVANNSTVPYPKCIGRWAWCGFERVTGNVTVEFVVFHSFAENGLPVACVKFDASDEHGNSVPTQTVRSMTLSPRNAGDAHAVWTYSATIPVATLTQGDVITVHAKAFPWVGDAASCIDTRTSADGVDAPSESLSPLMFLLDKDNVLAAYASVDAASSGVGAAVQATPALARTTPFQTVATALTALKAYKNANHGDNSLNGCELLMQNGTYTGPGSFTGGNTKAWCIIRADLENGATEAGVVFSTATNASFAGYLKCMDVSFSGSGAGMLRGSPTAGVLWLHSCTLSSTSTSFAYQWRVCWVTQSTVTASSVTGFKPFGANRGAFALLRGNDASAVTGGVSSNMYCALGNKGIQFNTGFVESGSTNDLSDNAIVAWNSCYGLSGLWISPAFLTSSSSKGLAVVGNVAEGSTGSIPLVQIAADNSNANSVSNILEAHNSFSGRRRNGNYHEGGNSRFTRENWFSRFNLYRDDNAKCDPFNNANRTLTDGVLNGTTTITSATANFVAGDVGQIIALEGVPGGYTTVSSVTNSTTAVMAAAATVSATGVRFGLRGYIENSARVDNWAWMHGVGNWGNRYEISLFPRDFFGIDVAVVGSQQMGYTLDKSVAGSGAGNGDYSLQPGSPGLNRVPAGMAMIPGDLNGRRISNTGIGAAGAIQPAQGGLLLLRRRRRR